jgi:Protein of unknown function (DUF2794)
MTDIAEGEAEPQLAGAGLAARRWDDLGAGADSAAPVSFSREELRAILALYGRKVAAGEWRDYAIDFTRERAVFSVFRRAAEVPLYRIEKDPKLALRQGAFSVANAAGLIMKRGHDLARVLRALDKDRFKVLAG